MEYFYCETITTSQPRLRGWYKEAGVLTKGVVAMQYFWWWDSVSVQRTLKTKRCSVAVSTLNPKCVTVGELYGEFNPTTMEWKDGLLSHIYRKYVKVNRGVMRGPRRKSSASLPNAQRTSSAKSFAMSATSVEENSEGEMRRLITRWAGRLALKFLQ